MGTQEERIAMTNSALSDRAEYIYQGVLAHGDLFGIPDLLYWDGNEYLPIDIKSGSAETGSDDDANGKPKKHYAVQLALYCDILIRRRLHKSKRGYVIDATGERVEYLLDAPQGPRTPETFFQLYERLRKEAIALIKNETQNDPANCSSCGDCGWKDSCKKWVLENDDLTQLFYIGRAVRDAFRRDLGTTCVADVLRLDVGHLVEKKKTDKAFLKGIGSSTLEKLIIRARLLKENGKPMMRSRFDFPLVSSELFFDLESDPTQDLVYLHGFWVRDPAGERFIHFTAREASPEAERRVFEEALEFIQSYEPAETAIYYYSPYERTCYRRLRKKFPDVIAEDELEAIFAHPNCIDLYDVVSKNTEWPLGSYGIKAIAQYLGFSWRDETPSGALSIQWYNDFLNTGDAAFLDRVLEYNEDDCKATMVVKDFLKEQMETT